jgi:flagellar hook-associated protein 2
MGLRLGGLSSGLDTGALVEAMLRLERRPLQLVQQQVAELEKQKELFGELGTKLTALRDAAAAIDNLGTTFSGPSLDEELLAYAASSSDEASIRATASGSASPGAVSVRVISLASAARRVSGSFASDSAVIANAGDTLDIAFGGGSISITAPAAGASLRDLASAINGDANNDGSVRADVLFDGTGYRLVVRGTETGAANDVTLTTTIAGPGATAFLDAGASQAGVDASLDVFGLTVTRASNTVSDVIGGVTLELVAASATAALVQVELDEEAVAAKLDAFAAAYNEVLDFIEAQSQFDAKAKTAGPLSGDSTLRSVQSRIQRLVFDDYSFGNLGGLVDAGVRFDGEGKLSVDRDALGAALASDASSLRQLFGGDGTTPGLASQLAQAIDVLAKSNKIQLPPDPNDPNAPPKFVEVALLPARSVAIDARIDSLEAQIERMEARLEKREELLVAQFSRMESLVSQLREQGNSLSGLTVLRINSGE